MDLYLEAVDVNFATMYLEVVDVNFVTPLLSHVQVLIKVRVFAEVVLPLLIDSNSKTLACSYKLIVCLLWRVNFSRLL